jgi:hypothetical protein
MADFSINLTILDAFENRFMDVVDNLWPGRTLEVPVPTKKQWAKSSLKREIKERVKVAERENKLIDEIQID